MDFTSPTFLLLFLPLFVLAYHVVRRRGKLMVGLAGSLLFYTWGNLDHLPLILGMLIATYFLARGIDAWRGERKGVLLLWIGCAASIALLVGFKLRADLAYPLGLSYISFQVISYLIDVHAKSIDCETDLLSFAFYVLLFPKILVGPITRYGQLQGQIRDLQPTPMDVAEGLRRFMRGFAKKALIADMLGKVVVPVFNLDSPVIAPPVAWLVIISYALQLYFDFSGYTDMALGLGRMMGLQLPENFNLPYLATSIGDFWRRWHISLSSWFRDYVFYPLDRRWSAWLGQPTIILIVFVLTGMWHGPTINFILWGAIHALALIFESTAAGRSIRTAWPPLRHTYALGVIVFSWVFFRSPTPDYALDFLRRLLGDTSGLRILPFQLTSPLPFIEPSFVLALAAGMVLCLPLGARLDAVVAGLTRDRAPALLALQLANDLGLVLVFWAAIAAQVSADIQPAIYGKF